MNDKNRRRRGIFAFATLTLVALWLAAGRPAAFAADPGKEALVIGISHYSDAQLAGNDKSIGNDVKLMREALQKRGFHVNVLSNEQATHEAILGTLKSYRPGIDQFVLYYAGKSESDVFNGKSWIYPYDTDAKSRPTWLSARELRAAVEDVPAVSRTVILDTPAAGYLMNAPARKWVCYCVSSQARQGAAVGQFSKDDELDKIARHIEIDNRLVSSFLGKEPAGIFTHYLARGIENGNPDQSWNDLMNNVASGMQRHVGTNQTPDLTPDYVSTRVFFISPLLLTRSPMPGYPARPQIAQTTTLPASVAAPIAPPAETPAPPAIEPPAPAPAKTFNADAGKRLTALWTGADGNPDEDKGRAMVAASVQAALSAGADPDTTDAAGLTLLLIAAGTNRADIAKLAIAAHCDINFKNDGLGTALVEAAYVGAIDVVKLLLANNADLTATKDGNVTALGAAKSDYDGKTPDTVSKIVALLTAKGATN